MLRLHDTATGSPREVLPRDGELGLYVCGVTPYDAAHLGHAFTYHVFDVLTRRLRAAGVRVRSVRNVTDCDDDIFRVARERRVDHRRLVEEQVARFEEEMRAIDILPVDAGPWASAHVPAMIDWIARLAGAGAAYPVEGWVYFSVAAFSRYGALSRLTREEMLALGRSRGADPDDPRKRDPLDFVLWQPSLPDELSWESPWGRGRPGWHIECSVLAASFLPAGVDVHGGGEDLVYPHHESEIAQAEAVSTRPFARHWVHVAMVQLAGTKMSKSLGNLVFTGDLVQRRGASAVRLLLASHHHRSAWSYEEAELDAAWERLRGYQAAVTAGGGVEADHASSLERDFFACLDDDLDTAGALRVLDEAARACGATPTPHAPVGAALLIPRLLDVLGAHVDLGAAARGGLPV